MYRHCPIDIVLYRVPCLGPGDERGHHPHRDRTDAIRQDEQEGGKVHMAVILNAQNNLCVHCCWHLNFQFPLQQLATVAFCFEGDNF